MLAEREWNFSYATAYVISIVSAPIPINKLSRTVSFNPQSSSLSISLLYDQMEFQIDSVSRHRTVIDWVWYILCWRSCKCAVCIQLCLDMDMNIRMCSSIQGMGSFEVHSFHCNVRPVSYCTICGMHNALQLHSGYMDNLNGNQIKWKYMYACVRKYKSPAPTSSNQKKNEKKKKHSVLLAGKR